MRVELNHKRGMEGGEQSFQRSSVNTSTSSRKRDPQVGRKRRRNNDEIAPEPVVEVPEIENDQLDETFNCVICLGTLTDPEVTKCGHTFCNGCIRQHINHSSQCPLCKANLGPNELVPNFAIRDHIILTQKPKRNKANKPDLSDPDFRDAWLSSLTSLTELNMTLSLLQQKREALIFSTTLSKKSLLTGFLEDFQKIKKAEKKAIEQELSLIELDLCRIKTTTSFKQGPMNEMSSQGSTTSVIGSGFNTKALSSDQATLGEKKSRINSHFPELSKLYLSARNSQLYDAKLENVVPSSSGSLSTSPSEDLDEFGRTLFQVSAYQGLKPLATINYSVDVLTSTNIASSVEFDKNGEFFCVAGTSGKMRIFEYASVVGSSVEYHHPYSELICQSKVSSVAWSNYYGNQMASSDYDGCVDLWDVAVSKKLKSFSEHQKRVWSVDWCPQDPRILASGSDDEKIRLWSTTSDRSVATIFATGNICTVKFSPDSYTLACGGTDKCIYTYDIRQTHTPLGVLKGHTKSVSHVKFLNSKELVSASTDNHLNLWDPTVTLATAPIRTFQGHQNEKNFVGLATDGHFIACGSEDNSLYVYSKVLTKPLFSFKFDGHLSMFGRPAPENTSTEFVSTVGWKKDSPIIVGANSQGAIKILQLI